MSKGQEIMKTAKLMPVAGTGQVVVCDHRNQDAAEYELPAGYSVQSDALGRDIIDADGVSAGVHADHAGRIFVSTLGDNGEALRHELRRSAKA